MSKTDQRGAKNQLRANLSRRTDATHTVDVRREWQREFARRFRRLRGLVRRTVGYQHDAANLTAGPQSGRIEHPPYTGEPEPVDAFPALTTGLLLAAFSAWFTNAARRIVLDPTSVTNGVARPDQVPIERWDHWTRDYTAPAFVRGVNQSTGMLFRAGVSVENLPNDEILADGGFRPAVQQRFFSPLHELDGLTRDMADEMDATLRQAIDEGWNPRKTAEAMTTELSSLERDRAYTIASTETLFGHSNAAIENYRRAGVDTVGHVGRIVTPDESLCPFCRRLADETFTLSEFAGTRVLWRGTRYFVGTPSHPRGRCSPIPRPGVDPGGLGPLEDRVPGTIIARGLNMYGPRDGQAFA